MVQRAKLGRLARATEARERTKEDTVHAPLIGRLGMALAEVQELVAISVGKLKRTTRRVVWLIRQPPENDQDPVLAMLASAPVDDEPITDDDRRHIEEGRQAFRAGRVVSSEEARRACLDGKGEPDRKEASQAAVV